MNVIGGMTSLVGALLGTVFMVTLPELLRGYVNLQQIMFGAILFATMAFLPGGLIELGRRLRELLWGRRAMRCGGGERPAGLERARRHHDAPPLRRASEQELRRPAGGRRPELRRRCRRDPRHHRAQRRRQDHGRQSRLRRHQADQRPGHAVRPRRHGPGAARAGRRAAWCAPSRPPSCYAGQTVRENLLRGAFREIYPGLVATLLGTGARARGARPRRQPRRRGDALARSRARRATSVASSLPYGFQKVLGMGIGLAARPRLDHAR